MPGTVRSALRLVDHARQVGLHVIQLGQSRESTVIHCNFVSPAFSQLLVTLYCRLARCPVLITIHDVRPHYSGSRRFLAAFDTFVHGWAYRLASGLHVHTDRQLEDLRKLYRGRLPPCIVVPFGVDPETRRNRGRDEASLPLFLVAGALRENKCIREIIQAFLRLREGGLAVKLRITGRAPVTDRRYWSECRQLIDQNPAGIHVDERYIAEAEFDEHIEQASCVICAYANYSSQSAVVLKAAMLETPVLVSTSVDVPGVSTAELAGGVTISETTPEGISVAMKAFLEIPEAHRKAIGPALRVACIQNASWDKVAIALGAEYKKLAAAHREMPA